MTGKIRNAILSVSLITFLCCMLVVFGVSYPYFNEQLEAEIESEAEYLAAGVELGGTEYLDSFESEHRITLIAADGTVIYDTVTDAGSMENHSDREEVIEALESGQGESRRYSGTLTEKTLYFAKRLSDGTVLRVSSVQITVSAVLFRMIVPITAALILVIAISALLASSLSKKIVKPINELDIEDPDIGEDYTELSPLLHKISRQSSLIDLQMEDLKRQQEEFLTITHNMSEGLILIDTKTEVLSYNKSALKLFAVTKTDLGDSVLTFNRSEAFSNAVNRVLGGERCETLIEVNGKTLQIFANPVKVEEKVSGAVLLILDITEKEQRDAMRREFTSNVSHELKTPLTSIYGISEIMMNGIVRAEDMTKFAANIHDESGRLITLVNDIIRLSQLDEKALELDREEIDLHLFAGEIINRLSHVAKEHEITMTLEGEPTFITGIPSIISEMIYNLCDNAIKYNRDGGSVKVTVGTKKDHPTLSVSDTGIGIPREHIDRVFERFYRVDKSHSRKIGGTGLGLSIVKHGAAVHNARVKIESREGEGTTVTVTFENEKRSLF